MRRLWSISLLMVLALFALSVPPIAKAQEGQQPTSTPQPTPSTPTLNLYTLYPSQVIGIGENITFNLILSATVNPQTVKLDMTQIPDGWTATFQGGGQIVQAAYVLPGTNSTVSLRLEPPATIEAGTYNFVVTASGQNLQSELPLEVTIKSKLPPRLSLTSDLPTLKGSPSTTFSYNVALKNEGDVDLSVNLVAQAPDTFQVNFKLLGQDVTSIPLAANETKNLTVQFQPVGTVAAGSYPITIQAQGGDAQASLTLTADVTGQSQLAVTSPDGRLSGQATIGKATSLKVTIKNTGSAPARQIALTSSAPSGWTVDFNPAQIPEIPANQQVDVTANIRPADQAVAGDYMVTVNARPADGATTSADFRITVLTSTLWGVVGIGLVAVSLGVVALAVVRFGRR